VTRRPSPRAARVAVVAALTAGWALALAPTGSAFAAAAVPTPSPAPPATAEPGQPLATFGLTSASGGVPDDRGFLAITAPPGSVIYDSVAVVNQGDQALDLALDAADALNTADGSIGLPDRATKPTAAGAWITLAAPTVAVPPQSASGIGYTVVPVTVTIPADAEPGDHMGGVVTTLSAQGTATGGDQSATVNLDQRVGIRVYITVDGPTKGGLVVTGVSASYTPGRAFGLAGAGSLSVRYTLTNSGNVRVGVDPSVRAGGPFGLLARTVSGPTIDELLPGASVDQTVEVPNVWPLVLDSVVVSATAVAAPGRDDPGIGTVTGSGHAWAVPWALLAIVLLLVGGWLLLRRRRRHRINPRAGRHAGDGNGAPLSPPRANELPATSPLPDHSRAVP